MHSERPQQAGQHPPHVMMEGHLSCMDVVETAKEKTVEGRDYQRTPMPPSTGKEVGGPKHSHVNTDEFLPGCGGLTHGAGGTPWRFKMFPTVWSLIR